MRSLKLYPSLPYTAVEEAIPLGRDLDPGCTLCPLHEKVRTVCMPAEGDPGGLLVVGESPQAEDDRKGVAFASPTGAWVRNEIAKHWTGPVVYDNAIRCFPGSREVKDSAIDACRPYLAQTVAEINPMRVLVFGGDALKSVIGRTFHAFSSRRGYAYMPSMNVPVFMLIPPPMALRNRYVRSWLEEDIKWALQACPPQAPTDGIVMYVTTPEEAEDACFELRTGAELVYDTETFGAPHDPEFKITTLAINVVGDHNAYVWDERALKDPGMSAPLKRLLEDPKVPKGGQNIKYDALAARASFGARTRPMTFDVRLIRKMLEADAHAALEVMQTRVGMGGGKDEAGDYVKEAVKEIRKAVKDRQPVKPSPRTGKIPAKKPYTFPWRGEMQASEYATMLDRVEAGTTPKKYAFAFMPEDVRGVYCARDAVSTGLLKNVFYGDLQQRPELIKLWENVTVPLMHAITEIEWNGIKMSIPALQQLTTAMTTKEADYRAQLAQYVWPDFNPSASSPDTGKMLFNAATDDPPGLGLKVRRTTATGKPGTSVGDIAEIKHPVIPILLGLRKVMHFKSQYADGLASALRADGRIHTYYKIDGTTCMPAGELVLTHRGYLPVEQVNVGDEVISHTGQVRAVTARQVNKPAEIYKVRLQNGLELRTTSNHEYRVGSGWIRADELIPGDLVTVHADREQWRPIVGWPPFDVSSWGRVRNSATGHVLSLQPKGRWGHLKVSLKRHGARTRGADYRDFAVHRLVINAFGGSGDGETRHVNGIAWDNGTRNLVYGTARDNRLDAVRHGTMSKRGASGKLTEEAVQVIRSTPRGPTRWHPELVGRTDQELADEFGVSRKLVGDVRNGLRWQRQTTEGKIAEFYESTMIDVQVEAPEVTYGLTVAVDHSHVTSGMVTHNTGRPSTEDPNLLNIPRASSPEGKMCRDLFVPEDGWVLVEGDYNQIELRVAAMLSEDDVMIDVFKGGHDFHLETARMIAPYFKVDPATVMKDHPLRSRAKIVNFGVLYGKDSYGLAMELDIPKKEAQQLVDAILGKFRKLAAWIQNQLKLGRMTGWTRTWWDGADARYRPLWQLGGHDDDARQSAERSTWNSSIQGTATEFTNASLGAIQKWIEDDGVPAKLVLTVYDSIVAEVRADALDEYVFGAKRIMEGWPAKGMPIAADFKAGHAWGSLVDIK